VDAAECSPKTFTRFLYGPGKLTCRIAHHPLVTSLLLSNITISDQISRRGSVVRERCLSSAFPRLQTCSCCPVAPSRCLWFRVAVGTGVTLVEVLACPRERIEGGVFFCRVPCSFGIWRDFGASGTWRSGVEFHTENVSFKLINHVNWRCLHESWLL
jgi:hypothetical protein